MLMPVKGQFPDSLKKLMPRVKQLWRWSIDLKIKRIHYFNGFPHVGQNRKEGSTPIPQ
jgi:hypothetical protein